jgi:hypothetical protein
MSSPTFSLNLPTSTSKENSGARVFSEDARARDYNESTLFNPLDMEMDSMKLEDIEKSLES